MCLLITSVFLILAAAYTITDHATYNTAYYGTGSTVLLVDHRTGHGTTGTTNDGTFSSLAPAFFLGGIGRSRTIGATITG